MYGKHGEFSALALFYGICAGAGMWFLLLVADFIDEMTKSNIVTGIVILLMPIVHLTLFLMHKNDKSLKRWFRKNILKKEEPPKKAIVLRPSFNVYVSYYFGYNILFSIVWRIMISTLKNDIEYALYGITALILFDMILLIISFQQQIKKLKTKKEIKSEKEETEFQ